MLPKLEFGFIRSFFAMRDHIDVCPLSYPELQIPIAWAASEGWNPGLNDGECFFAQDNQGFWGLRKDGKIIATISAVRYDGGFGFIGFFIVEKALRNLGYGRQIWDHAIQRLSGYCIGLDGVVEQQEFYRKSGFVLAHRNIRYQGIAQRQSNQSAEITRYRPQDFERISSYDAIHFAFPRESFLISWLSQKDHTAHILQDNHSIKGYGVIRKCLEGYKIGPLFADDYPGAKAIMQALINTIPIGESFFLDIPQPNLSAQKLVEQYQMNKVFETARMYLGSAPSLPIDRIYGISSFELG
jgi:GNAT superfamily N-acetyltransferase